MSCPRCQGEDVVPILRGYLSPAGWEMVERGEVVTRGCYMGGPGEYCKGCGLEFDDPRVIEQRARQSAELARQMEAARERMRRRGFAIEPEKGR